MPYFGVVLHRDGTYTVFDPQTEGQFAGQRKALDQARRACDRDEGYTAVEAPSRPLALIRARALVKKSKV